MHNCKRTRDTLIDLTLGELTEAQARALTSELDQCDACRCEQLAIAGTLRVTGQALSVDHGSEEFWPGYRQRLHNKLRQQPPAAVPSSISDRFWNIVKALTTSSVRVPLPAASAALALVCVLSFAALSRGQVDSIPVTPTSRVEVQTVHVPVVQEKVIRQVVYRDRKRARPYTATFHAATAKAVPDPGAKLNLVGFKPADEVKMTIIKGNDQDEK